MKEKLTIKQLEAEIESFKRVIADQQERFHTLQIKNDKLECEMNRLESKKTKLIEKIEALPMYDGGYLVNTGTFKGWVIQILKTGTADVLEDYIIEGGRIVRKK